MSKTVPQRHWRSNGTDPLPTGIEALGEPFNAFPSWFLRVECDRCGKVQMVNQAHLQRSDMSIRLILEKMRHDGCGGLAGKAELITGIEAASSRRVAGGVGRRRHTKGLDQCVSCYRLRSYTGRQRKKSGGYRHRDMGV